MTEPRIIHLEIVGKDQKALQSYWSSLLGWKLDTSSPGGCGCSITHRPASSWDRLTPTLCRRDRPRRVAISNGPGQAVDRRR
jgi:hypothetical protein